MQKKKISIKDIAAKLNVSVTTVSFVLNGKGKEKKISDKMIERVLAFVKEINYKPNQLAQSLRTGKSKIIVFMVEDISNYFFAKIARIMEELAHREGYNILFCSNENNDSRSKELIQLFKERQVDGYILNPSPGIKNEVADLIAEKIPVVLFDRYFPNLKTNYVVINNEIASYQATDHLIKNGYKKIGFITIESHQIQMQERKRGYKRAIEEHGLLEEILEIKFELGNYNYNKEMIKDFIFSKNLDSVYFSTNYLTQSGLEIFHETDPKLLNTYGIVTFDDHEFFKIHTPSISAIAQPKKEIAENLINIILSRLKGTSSEKVDEIVLNGKLIERDSSKKLI